MPPTINIGAELAAITQFLVIMIVLQPIIAVATPAAFQKQFYGNIVNTTLQSYTSKIVIPLAQQANSTSGFGAISPGNLQIFGGLSFIYGAFSAFMSTIWNMPSMIYLVFTGTFAYIDLVPGIAAIISLVIIGYITVINIMIGISLIMKGSVQEGG